MRDVTALATVHSHFAHFVCTPHKIEMPFHKGIKRRREREGERVRERENSYAAPNEFSTCVLWIFLGLPDILRDCHQFSVALPLHFAYR